MRTFVVLLLSSLGPALAAAQPNPDPSRLLLVTGGFGITLTDEPDGHDGSGAGGFLAAELVFFPRLAVTPRLYAGALMTFADEDSCGAPPCDVQSKIFFLGAKVRLMAPIPYVGPFIEAGLGVSAGYLRTRDLDIDEETRGGALHVPFALGLAIGKRHEYDIVLSYLWHPAQDQLAGAVAFGLQFPLP